MKSRNVRLVVFLILLVSLFIGAAEECQSFTTNFDAAPAHALPVVDFPAGVTPTNNQVQVGACSDVMIQPALMVPSVDVGKTVSLIMYIYLPDLNFGINIPSKTKTLTAETKFDLLPNVIDFSDSAGLNFYVYYGYMVGSVIKYNAYSVGVGLSCAAYIIGSNVCVQWDDDFWYHAQITDVSEDHIRVHYTGYDTSSDEWVVKGSTVNMYSPQINDTAWVFWKAWIAGSIFEAKILDKNSSGYYVHYVSDGSDTTFDKWVGLCEVFPMPQAGDYLWVSLSHNWIYGQVISHTNTDEWNVRWGGYAYLNNEMTSDFRDGEDTFSPPDIVPATPEDQQHIKEEFDDHASVPPPTGIQTYTFRPVENPDVLGLYSLNAPSKIKPIGIGNIVTGGSTMNVSFTFPYFTDLMNIYFAVVMQGEPPLFYGADQTWHTDRVPFIENAWGPDVVTPLANIPVSTLPDITYNFYLFAAKGSDWSNRYVWNTSYTKNQTGYFTGLQNSCLSTDINTMVRSIIQDIEARGDSNGYDQLKSYVSTYKDADGNENMAEAFNMIALTAYGENKVYPFCWALLNNLYVSPGSAFALNAAAVSLFELGKIDEAGFLLDCAYRYDPELSITYSNGGVYHAHKGNVTAALESFKKAMEKSPEVPHRAWDAYHYAVRHNKSTYKDYFLTKIPRNFSLQNNDGTTGTGPAELIVCCNCNGGIYHDLGQCLDECTVSLACFTHICSPRLECCDGKGPFGLGADICYPPIGPQVCFGGDAQGKLSIKVGANLPNIISAHFGASTNFQGNYTLFVGASTGRTQHTLNMLTTDPNTKNWSSQHQVTTSVSLGLVTFGANTEPANWSKSMLCELYPAQ